MDEFTNEAFEQGIFGIVDANHRRAVLRAQEVQEEAVREDMPTWACVAWTVALALMIAGCMIYASL